MAQQERSEKVLSLSQPTDPAASCSAPSGSDTEAARIARLEREVEELRSANEILRQVAGFLADVEPRPLGGRDRSRRPGRVIKTPEEDVPRV